MADQRIGNRVGVTALNDVNGTQRSNLNGSTAANTEFDSFLEMSSISALKTRLAAIDATFYTAKRLNTMTYNDMIYAVRRNDSPTTIKA